jgi:DNA polymerase-3 subunit gamma/tau
VAASEEHSEHEGRVGSLYRRHRPRSFADVVGQEPVVRTLRNAVERGKVHHAYLFVGSRGTGKTSMAKILAACLNCEHGPTVEPCGRCESCRAIAAATSLDVIEMDAASNNSVDDIRDLRESVAYAPVSGRRKVYILDEAHMLSTAAWNAFLKTLEEPPPNTVFVLATTEAAKVPATVIDRCHRFDFHRPTVEQIAGVVRRAADADSISIPPPAVAAIARSATGSFRDALGTLEQLVTYSGSEISLEDVLAVLGVADSRLIAEAIDAVAAHDARGALAALERCAAQGRDPAAFAGDLEARLRETMIVQTVGGVPPELSLTPEADAALAEQAERVPHATVVRMLELLGEALEAIRAGADGRTRLELALVKAARPEVDSSMRALLARIEALEQSARPIASAVAAQREVPAPAPPRGGGAGPEAPAADPDAAAPPPPPGEPSPSAAAPPPPPSAAAPAPAASGAGASQAPPSAPGPPPRSEGSAAPPPSAAPASAASPAAPAAGEPATAAAAALARASAEEPSAAEPQSLAAVEELWPAVVDMVRGENARLGAAIERARPVEVKGEELTIAFGSSFLKKQAEGPADRMTVGESLTALTRVRWRLSYELRADLDAGAEQDAEDAGAGSDERWLARFMEEFDAEEIPYEGPPTQASPGEPKLTSNEKGA